MKIRTKARNIILISIASTLIFFIGVRIYFANNPYIPAEYLIGGATVYDARYIPLHPLDLFGQLGRIVGLLAISIPSDVILGQVFNVVYTVIQEGTNSAGTTCSVSSNYLPWYINHGCRYSDCTFNFGIQSLTGTCLNGNLNGGYCWTITPLSSSGIVGAYALKQFKIDYAGTYNYQWYITCTSTGSTKQDSDMDLLTARNQANVCGNGACETPYECMYASNGQLCDNPCKADCGEVLTICGDGQCTSGIETCSSCSIDCGVCPNQCEPLHHHLACNGKDSYYIDACGNFNDLFQSCPYGCNNGVCVQCYSNNYKSCVGNDLYNYDSCGNQGSYITTCTGNTKCSNGGCVPVTSCTDDCSWTGTKCYDRDNDGINEIVPCGNYDTDACKDYGTLTECSSSESCTDTSGGAVCKNTCTNDCTLAGYSCELNSVVLCSNSDSDPCLDKQTVTTCGITESCIDSNCVPNEITCINECESIDYPQCSTDEVTVTYCTDIDNDGCLNLWNSRCGEGYSCMMGECTSSGDNVQTYTINNGVCEYWFGEDTLNSYADCSQGIKPRTDYVTPIIIVSLIIIGIGVTYYFYKKRRG
jgi:hypothetical protein